MLTRRSSEWLLTRVEEPQNFPTVLHAGLKPCHAPQQVDFTQSFPDAALMKPPPPPSPYVIRSDSLCGNTTLWNGCVPTGSRAAKLKLRVFKEFWSWDLWCYIITAVAFNALRTTAARFLHSVFVISVSHLTQKKHKNYFLKFPLLTILIQFTWACSQTNLTLICQIDGCDWANRWLKPVVFIKGPSGN